MCPRNTHSDDVILRPCSIAVYYIFTGLSIAVFVKAGFAYNCNSKSRAYIANGQLAVSMSSVLLKKILYIICFTEGSLTYKTVCAA